jgi:hypothetical protein
VGTTNLSEAIRQVLVTDLLPPTQRAALESVLKNAGISQPKKRRDIDSLMERIVVNETFVEIGDFHMMRKSVDRPEMVPSPRFFDISRICCRTGAAVKGHFLFLAIRAWERI